ncbi:MAG TPA: hypothetical protein VG274_10360 [Rhizomicrobium sp.]|nr:hypothetical protein [Rhizomicrobium sp.]
MEEARDAADVFFCRTVKPTHDPLDDFLAGEVTFSWAGIGSAVNQEGVFLMNKYLMLSAAAVLASATGAYAGTFQHSFTFGTAGGSPYCDGGSVYTSGATVWSWQHTNNNCSGGVSYGQGLLEKNGLYGKNANMSDNFFGKNYGIFSEYLNYVLPKKIKNGKPWELYVGINGTTSFFGNSGVLVDAAAAKGRVSTASMLKGLIQTHRASH